MLSGRWNRWALCQLLLAQLHVLRRRSLSLSLLLESLSQHALSDSTDLLAVFLCDGSGGVSGPHHTRREDGDWQSKEDDGQKIHR